MFFALSGFLITGLLLGELERDGRVDLRRFYARRACRLVPALLLLVVGVVVVTLLLDPLDDRDEPLRTVVVALTWTGSLPFDRGSETFHLWTLASVVWSHESPDLAYALPTSWAGCFVIGAATRVLADRVDVPSPSPARWLRLGVPLALLGLGVLSVVPLRGHALTYLAGGPAIALLTAVLLLSWCTLTTVRGPALRALVWLGTVSYATYLWNYPLTLWVRPHLDLAGPVAALLTLAMAALSWWLVEAPAQRLRRGLQERRQARSAVAA